MLLSLRALLFAAAVLWAFAPLAASGANESLYDKSTAQKIDLEQQSLLGPQSKNFRYDKRMLNALKIASDRAHKHSTSRCWRYVKTALMAGKVIDTYPKTAYAKQAGGELQNSYGFKKLSVRNPYKAPLGSVIVYGGRGAGHVEIRTKSGIVSDFATRKASPRPLIGVYVKPRA
jgi:hypothetical protein